MLIFYLAILALCCVGLRVNRVGLGSDYLEKKRTDSIKGLFILLVFLRHSISDVSHSGYQPEGLLDILGFRFNAELGQLIVAMFLFYSGYGVMESFKKKGPTYIKRFPRHRILTTLLNFDVAVFCFFCMNLILGIKMNPRQVGLSLIGWESIGNSNWYIFVILFCYLCSWCGRRLFSTNDRRFVFLTTCLVFAGQVLLSYFRHGQVWWYNTILCYPAGLWYSFILKDKHLAISKKFYFPILGLLVTVFLFLHLQHLIPGFRGGTYNIESITFALIVVHLSMVISVGNQFLRWAGMNLFPLYIYQRLPLNSIRELLGPNWVCSNSYLFICICAGITGGIALLYKNWQISLK